MIRNKSIQSNGEKSIVRYTYLATLFMLTLTGFAQMPIFKRYYIADIPGLGWLADFYITHYMHYLFSVLLFAVIAYMMIEYIYVKRKEEKLLPSDYIHWFFITGLIITGIIMVVKNFSGYWLSPKAIIILDLTHLGLVMGMLMAGLVSIVLKKFRSS